MFERIRHDATMVTHHVVGQRKSFALSGQNVVRHRPALPHLLNGLLPWARAACDRARTGVYWAGVAHISAESRA